MKVFVTHHIIYMMDRLIIITYVHIIINGNILTSMVQYKMYSGCSVYMCHADLVCECGKINDSMAVVRPHSLWKG